MDIKAERPISIGVVFPQTEMKATRDDITTFLDAVQAAGFDHLLAYDHVLGADPESHPGWSGPYSMHDPFHEVFTLFGFVAGRIDVELVTSVLVLPQRQTVLVAKQAAQLDIMTNGRLRLGVGTGWNEIEYRSLGASFQQRGQRIEEQVALLRRLWTEPSLHFAGDHEVVDGAGLVPQPRQRPIPIWMGGGSTPRVLDRIGRLADGWMPSSGPGQKLATAWDAIRRAAESAQRDPASIGLQGGTPVVGATADEILERVDRWRQLGASHVAVNTLRGGFGDVQEHVDEILRVASILGLGRAARRTA